MLAVLSAIAVVFFLLTNLAVSSYRNKERELAKEWAGRGRGFLRTSQPSQAVEAFQTSLRYEPGAQDVHYAMVDSLLAAGRPEQARSYLLSLWEQQPANGLLNLDLARIAAARGDVAAAARYYHNAIYGVWDSSAQTHRIQARFELAQFLLAKRLSREADAELLAVAANVPPTPELALRLGEFFLQAGDPDNAQQQFEMVLKASPHDPTALAAAGRASFELGRYAPARSYLEQARARGNTDTEAERLSELCDLILNNDPLDRTASWTIRVQRAVRALATATDRVEACASQADKAGGSPVPLEQILQQLEGAQQKANLRALRQDPDRLIASANLAFAAEEAAAKVCGQPQGLDLALLLIGRSHSENSQ